ncbi:conserved hypothetical protein [Ricinus communis]|uniref:Uncharacterized protein n=1 Tax=Ricinus communis TaxID=3988 RepID=B9S839_RICCO|nr:conserved hypothetical protein [Ricinus communis]
MDANTTSSLNPSIESKNIDEFASHEEEVESPSSFLEKDDNDHHLYPSRMNLTRLP